LSRHIEQGLANCYVADRLNIGVYILPTNEFALIPSGFFEEKDKKVIERALQTPLIETMIGGTSLLGILAVANSKSLLLPRSLVTDLEIEELEIQLGEKVGTLNTKITALGNVIVANQNGAIISPEFTPNDVRIIEDTFEIPVTQRDIAGISVVGAMCVVTSKGALVSPLASDEEVELISNVFGVKTDICTVNRGYAFISTGLAANNKGALCGKDTTGIERARILDILY